SDRHHHLVHRASYCKLIWSKEYAVIPAMGCTIICSWLSEKMSGTPVEIKKMNDIFLKRKPIYN
ncbi:hypothetical protein, partial [Klebsiella oxytoca]|uniref:hypothetical protein n=1 Tax=Klebsiella oxytoca TaxID=571 RepID=UPI001CD01D17